MTRLHPKSTSRPRQLRKIYRSLLTTSIVHRIETLKTALHWYDQALAYISRDKRPLNTDWLNLEHLWLHTRREGIAAKTQEEKESWFRSAIEVAELLCKRMHPYPIAKAYAELEHYQHRTEFRRRILETRYFSVISVLTNALQPKSALSGPLAIRVADSSKAKAFNPVSEEIVYSRAAMKACRETLRKKGLLVLALDEIKTLSRVAAMEDDGEGHFKVNPQKQVNAIFEMLDNLARYCRRPDAPTKLVRRMV